MTQKITLCQNLICKKAFERSNVRKIGTNFFPYRRTICGFWKTLGNCVESRTLWHENIFEKSNSTASLSTRKFSQRFTSRWHWHFEKTQSCIPFSDAREQRQPFFICFFFSRKVNRFGKKVSNRILTEGGIALNRVCLFVSYGRSIFLLKTCSIWLRDVQHVSTLCTTKIIYP